MSGKKLPDKFCRLCQAKIRPRSRTNLCARCGDKAICRGCHRTVSDLVLSIMLCPVCKAGYDQACQVLKENFNRPAGFVTEERLQMLAARAQAGSPLFEDGKIV